MHPLYPCLMLCWLLFPSRAAFGRMLGNYDANGSALHSRRKRQTNLYYEGGFRELIGPRRSEPYCAGRRDAYTGDFLPCCAGRDDDCKMPFHDTACYCDEFCDRSKSSDCCPDQHEFCGRTGFRVSKFPTTTTRTTQEKTSTRYRPGTVSVETTTTTGFVDESYNVCYEGAVGYRLGDKIRRNCNKCSCERDGTGFYSFVCDDKSCLVEPAVIQVINRGQYGWTATNYSFFWGFTRGYVTRRLLGTKRAPAVVRNMTAISGPSSDVILPEEFDAREKWRGVIRPPNHQGKCGSSWAFSTTSVASDRLAIQSGGRLTIDLSTQHLLSCRRRRKRKKCRKERVDKAWWYLRRRGVVSSDCYPLTATYDGKIRPCRFVKQNPKCVSRNSTGEPTVYKMGPPYRVASDETHIMTEIYRNGPVQAVMTVAQDFFLYKSGIYNSLPKEVTGKKSKRKFFHSVKIVGWGTQKGNLAASYKYWIVQNSWGKDWGEAGYFRISRGENTNGIESTVLGVWPNIKTNV